MVLECNNLREKEGQVRNFPWGGEKLKYIHRLKRWPWRKLKTLQRWDEW